MRAVGREIAFLVVDLSDEVRDRIGDRRMAESLTIRRPLCGVLPHELGPAASLRCAAGEFACRALAYFILRWPALHHAAAASQGLAFYEGSELL